METATIFQARPILEMKNIVKQFPGVLALNNVDFRLVPGKVHALMGENGAGKSTLMKIIAGIYQADEGQIFLNGKEVRFDSPRRALDSGIAMIHQELSSIMGLTVMENIFLGKEYRKKSGIIDYKKMANETKALLSRIGVNIAPNMLMSKLSVSQMQMVEITKALSYDSKIIIMDEPSSTITTREVEQLFGIIKTLRDEGHCIVYITHKMDEVFEIADEITVFRDGSYIGTYDAKDIDDSELIRLMVNRDLNEIFPKRNNVCGEVCMQVRDFSQEGVFEPISFDLHKSEILGFAGLMGAGRTELMNAMFGITKPTSGTITINGHTVHKPTPTKMISLGMGYVTEDRKGSGILPDMSVSDNMAITSFRRTSNKFGVVDSRLIEKNCKEFCGKLEIKTPSMLQLIKHLSGGNQQKVVLAKWLMVEPNIIVLDEPTRGIDVGAKTEIYRIIAKLAEEGKAIIFISSEMPEILGMCDRIIVLNEGKMSGETQACTATQESLLTFATLNSNKKLC